MLAGHRRRQGMYGGNDKITSIIVALAPDGGMRNKRCLYDDTGWSCAAIDNVVGGLSYIVYAMISPSRGFLGRRLLL